MVVKRLAFALSCTGWDRGGLKWLTQVSYLYSHAFLCLIKQSDDNLLTQVIKSNISQTHDQHAVVRHCSKFGKS